MDAHPYLVHFPIALLLTAAGAYIYGLFRPEAPLARTAILLHLIGIAALFLAIVSGSMAEDQVVQTSRIRELVSRHELLSYVSIWAFGLLALWHYLRQNRFLPREKLLYVLLFVLSAGLMAWSASLGGKMVYQEGAGVKPMQQQLEQQLRQESGQK